MSDENNFFELTESPEDFLEEGVEDAQTNGRSKNGDHNFEELKKSIKLSRVQNFISTQDYESIKKNFSNDRRFTDTEFKASEASLYFTSKFQSEILQNGYIVWKRAKDLVSHAHFAVDEHGTYVSPENINESNYQRIFHTTDLDQGSLGNCWFISAAAGIIDNYHLFKKVCPFDSSFKENKYTGAFRFRFWIFGKWKEVVVGE